MSRIARFAPAAVAAVALVGLGAALPGLVRPSPVMAAPSLVAVVDDDDHIAAREALRRGEILPLTRILEIALRAVPGDVIDVELDRHHGEWRYEVKVLTSTGRVREVKLNARTGVVQEIEDD